MTGKYPTASKFVIADIPTAKYKYVPRSSFKIKISSSFSTGGLIPSSGFSPLSSREERMLRSNFPARESQNWWTDEEDVMGWDEMNLEQSRRALDSLKPNRRPLVLKNWVVLILLVPIAILAGVLLAKYFRKRKL